MTDENRTVSTTDPISTRLAWICSNCEQECIPIRSESRCLCGHRHHAHRQGPGDFRCATRGCTCRAFFYIVAEGSWVLRCSCKHKHTDHHSKSLKCTMAAVGCRCERFRSPWVCNCNCPWAEHEQREVPQRQAPSWIVAGLAAVAGEEVQMAAEVNRWDLLRRGQEAASPEGVVGAHGEENALR
jgi:hypothetical protein